MIVRQPGETVQGWALKEKVSGQANDGVPFAQKRVSAIRQRVLRESKKRVKNPSRRGFYGVAGWLDRTRKYDLPRASDMRYSALRLSYIRKSGIGAALSSDTSESVNGERALAELAALQRIVDDLN
ncbi:hypothetical protein M408DRAFT_9019 [Serendipita vermifera MAFF 305830]|uniref:Uncharacterized protein n=1 Tax=Serendipita vermifera MAFF 305830 TaxID=933852 RepID=A0A0C3AUA0_SERVB|nr:hypothetical protein M408DRAFT_9019 [Serendipita vermifera MAFF 305830]